jgi:hypothetical protein
MPIETPHERTILSRRTRLALAVAAVAAAVLLAVPAAQAATFCVGSPSDCSGTTLPGDGGGLQQALTDAATNTEPDTVQVAAGTYTPPGPGGWDFEDTVYGIEIRGEGPTETILHGTGSSAVTLALTGAGDAASRLMSLGLELSGDGGTPTGLALIRAKAQNVSLTAPAGLAAGVGMRLGGPSARLTGSRVVTPGLRGIETVGKRFDRRDLD